MCTRTQAGTSRGTRRNAHAGHKEGPGHTHKSTSTVHVCKQPQPHIHTLTAAYVHKQDKHRPLWKHQPTQTHSMNKQMEMDTEQAHSTTPTYPLTWKRMCAQQEAATITHQHTTHTLLTGVSFSKASLRTPFSLNGAFTPGKSQRHPETQLCLHLLSLGSGNTFPSPWTYTQVVQEGAILGPITDAGCREGAHHHVHAPSDTLTGNGFE